MYDEEISAQHSPTAHMLTVCHCSQPERTVVADLGRLSRNVKSLFNFRLNRHILRNCNE